MAIDRQYGITYHDDPHDSGFIFEYVDVSTVRLDVHGKLPGGHGEIHVSNGFEIDHVEIEDSLHCSLTASGLGGLDTGAEVANTGYYVYLVTNKPKTSFGLIMSNTSSTPPTKPAGLDYISKPLMYAANVSGSSNDDLLIFHHCHGTQFNYVQNSPSVRVVDGSTETVRTGVDFSTGSAIHGLIPPIGHHVRVVVEASNDDPNTGTFNLYWTETDAFPIIRVTKMGNSAAGDINIASFSHEVPLHTGLSGSLWWDWTDTPGSPVLNISVLEYLIT